MVIAGIGICLISCQNSPKNQLKGNDKTDTTLAENKHSDILVYKVKEEFFNQDQLGLTFKNVYLDELSKNKFNLRIETEIDPAAAIYHANYYLILAIYPHDDELHLLEEERRKYRFEMFSIKIRKNKENKLVIGREVKTKIRSARAITISVIAYESKQKSQEIVMQNVKF